jgi:hypothetical protein
MLYFKTFHMTVLKDVRQMLVVNLLWPKVVRATGFPSLDNFVNDMKHNMSKFTSVNEILDTLTNPLPKTIPMGL